ncbi:MAG: quinone-dependent dihydroorotate dehydrogenase [Verrucomicrobia bacterium]|nr:quinone-dependent dihydroorotate dehydrogenase [Verrucomicrobiota bacterium]
MSWFYRRAMRPVLFERDSEAIHNRTLEALAWVSQSEIFCDALASFFEPEPLPTQLFGLAFNNPVGLAAGMDKHAAAVPAWAALGFGFSELGGVTWHPQAGNPAPRLFRAVADEALINRMGFNNPGAEAVAAKLAGWRSRGLWPNHPVGINLGKSKIVPLENAAEDYAKSLQVLWPWADFFVVNVSSPNTPNLRQLQDKHALDEVLGALQEINRRAAESKAKGDLRLPSPKPKNPSLKPLLLKIAPDLSWEAIDEIIEVIEARRVNGIVATNTTVARPDRTNSELQRVYVESGGLSGRPLRARSTEVIRHIYRQTKGTLPIVGVGGIFAAEDAWEKITAGASVIQLYTGLVYEGPSVVKEIVSGLRQRLASAGLMHLRQAVGLAAEQADGR